MSHYINIKKIIHVNLLCKNVNQRLIIFFFFFIIESRLKITDFYARNSNKPALRYKK